MTTPDDARAMFQAMLNLIPPTMLLLENRVERIEGRPGIPDDALATIMSEFRDMNS